MDQYYGQTTLHPLGLIAVCVLGTAMLLLPRRFAVLPMLIMACMIAPAQRLVVLSLDFTLLRIMVVFGFARLLMRNEFQGLVLKPLDYAVVLWAMTNTLAYTLLHMSADAFVNRLGFSFDAIGMYFLFRCLIRSWADIDRIIIGFVVMAIPMTVFFLIESMTGRNLFSVFGGVPEITHIREDRLRCQGAFAHPILAGCFWASQMPLMGALWWRSGWMKYLGALGVGLSLLIVVLCASSTPVLAVLAGAGGMAMFLLRDRMSLIRWGVVCMLVGLHMVMNAPVWHLISRVSAVGGSTGWHRYNLINNFIRHWNEWILLGIPSTGHWGYGMQDVTNQYVLEGVRGGLLSLALFIAAIALAYGRIGKLWRAARDQRQRIFAWALGVSLFVHCVSFIGVSYFGQIMMLWYLCLAAIGSMEGQARVVVRYVRRQNPRRLEMAGAST